MISDCGFRIAGLEKEDRKRFFLEVFEVPAVPEVLERREKAT